MSLIIGYQAFKDGHQCILNVNGTLSSGRSEGQLPHGSNNGRLFEDDRSRAPYVGRLAQSGQLTW